MRSQQKGFTLVELMVVVAIFAIISLIAYPNMTEWIAERRIANKAEQMANMFRLARGEAVRIGVPVYICPVNLSDAGSPNFYCQTSSPEGYAAFADVNKDNKFTKDVDLPLRTVVLNTPSRATMRYLFDNLSANYSIIRSGSEQARAAGYLPNGSFLRANYATDGTITTNPANSIIKIVLTDIEPKDKEKSRAQVMLLDSSGRVQFCKKSEIADAANKKCTFQ
ncbi:MAG: GspH/FimT family pseudopilin [Neisseria sp.]|uniref:GspH/FimT family pseudopilin n=1 Tax=Neisseria sp. TaxID=192066 RepID=UPI0026DD7D7C|nr:GspH/FimT family pseudopilin [Neisseria sp.]MDO4640196.1 GspH/FimT family pseudopilin [Neisseria sp.]